MDDNDQIMLTDEELEILPRVAGTMPWSAYVLYRVEFAGEFAERTSYYG